MKKLLDEGFFVESLLLSLLPIIPRKQNKRETNNGRGGSMVDEELGSEKRASPVAWVRVGKSRGESRSV